VEGVWSEQNLMIELPTKRTEAERTNPKKIILFSNPKAGKTEAVAALDDNLIIDVEDGSQFVNAMKINVLQIAKKEGKSPLTVLKEIITSIFKENEKKGSYVYKYITIDTVSALEDISLELANKLYQGTPMGRNWVGEDVTKLPNGAGYQYLREAMDIILNELDSLCDTLIILGHLKGKFVEKEGKEMESRGLALTGKIASILCSQVDAIGYVYRDENKTLVNFAPSESLIVGSRPEHLKNKIITLIESDENGKLTIDWSKIFIE
jgi:hypothetical protein